MLRYPLDLHVLSHSFPTRRSSELRTAEHLVWMARYMERAESTARLLTMGQRMAILPGAHHRDEWRSVVRATGALNHFPEGAQVTESDAIAFLMLDRKSTRLNSSH